VPVGFFTNEKYGIEEGWQDQGDSVRQDEWKRGTVQIKSLGLSKRFGTYSRIMWEATGEL
jgi:hypothetical protein